MPRGQNTPAKTYYHPCIHDSVWHAPRLLQATFVSPGWLRYMVVKYVSGGYLGTTVVPHHNVWCAMARQVNVIAVPLAVGALLARGV